MIVKIYSDNPNQRELDRVIEALEQGEVIIYPTHTGYAYGCDAMQARSVEKICQLKGADPKKKRLSIMCENLSMAAEYCRINNEAFRYIKEQEPGSCTFVLPVGSSLPKIFKNQKELGLRLASHPLSKLLCQSLGRPILSSSLPYDEENPEYKTDPELIAEKYGLTVELIVDGGVVNGGYSAIVNCCSDPFEVIHEGKKQL